MINLILLSTLTVLSTLIKARIRIFLTPLLAFCTFCFSAFLLYSKQFEVDVITFKLGFASLNFGFDELGLYFITLVSLMWSVASVYSYSYIKTNYPNRSDYIFQFCYSLAVLCAILFALAKDVFTMFIIYETLTLTTIPLVGFKKNNETKNGLFVYLIVLFGCSLLFLLPATLFTSFHSNFAIFDGSGFLDKLGLSQNTLKILLLLFIFGAGKAAFFPFHLWLPSAMVAPTPVSGLLHAVAVVKVGAFFILRVVVDIFGLDLLQNLLSSFNFLMYISGFTIVFASFMALLQSNLKKRLAYSTISQISYIALSLSTFTKLGVFVAMFQIISHAISKILLFFSVGAFYTSSNSNQIVNFTGMAQKNKVACLAFVFASLSLCGIPFTVGFLNKGLLFYNLTEANYYFGVAVIAISAFLSFAYLSPVCYVLFKSVPQKKLQNYKKIPLTFNLVFYVLFIVNILVFCLSGLFLLNYVNGR